MRRARRGFVLISVLWLLGVAGAVVGAAVAEGRIAIGSAGVRAASERAHWIAVGCLARARAEIDAALGARAEGYQRDLIWRSLHSVLPDLSAEGCEFEAEVVGNRYSINSADTAALLRVFASAGFAEEAVELLEALLDWRDGDDEPRAFGAETDWYRAHGLAEPSNAPLRTLGELQRIRGFRERPELQQLFTTDDPPIALLSAPVEVLSALDALEPVLLDHLINRRNSGAPVGTLLDLLSGGDSATQAATGRAYARLAGRVAVEPAAWLLRVAVRDRASGTQLVVEHRVRRTLRRVLVLEEREW